jgi:hypothetical protein
MASEKKFRLPKDIPLEEYPRPEEYLVEARRLAEEAQKQGMVIRVMGPIALHYYFPDYVDLYRRMERLGERVFTDIDYAAYGKHRSKLVPFFEKQGYDFDKDTMMYFGQDRHIYFGPRIPMIDVFYDKLDMNHCVDYRGRLEIHPYCVSLSDLLLQKLQIVQINDKDLKDGMLLLLAAQLGKDDLTSINLDFIAKRMSGDWGFYYTSTTNLGKIKTAMLKVAALTDDMRSVIAGKADQLLKAIEDEPKSWQWKLRAKTGTKKMWYKEVSDWN